MFYLRLEDEGTWWELWSAFGATLIRQQQIEQSRAVQRGPGRRRRKDGQYVIQHGSGQIKPCGFIMPQINLTSFFSWTICSAHPSQSSSPHQTGCRLQVRIGSFQNHTPFIQSVCVLLGCSGWFYLLETGSLWIVFVRSLPDTEPYLKLVWILSDWPVTGLNGFS